MNATDNNSPSAAVAAVVAAAKQSVTVVTKPKRPLSAFNLFYRYKRQLVLNALSKKKCEKDDITRIVEASPGLEDHPAGVKEVGQEEEGGSPSQPSPELNDLRRDNIRKELEGNLMPRDTRDRQHRTNQNAMNGAMSFLDLGKLMNNSWKTVDEFAKEVFNDLAEEGRNMYREKLKDYNDYASRMGLPKEETKAKKKKSKKRKDDSYEQDYHRTMMMGGAPGDLLSLLNQNQGGFPSGMDHNMIMRMAQAQAEAQRSGGGLQAMPMPMPSNNMNPGSPADALNEDRLRLRVQELEGQLAAERLRMRVQELEGALARQKSVEEQLRTHLQNLSRNGGLPSSQESRDGGDERLQQQQTPSGSQDGGPDGFNALVNASMIRNQERAVIEEERNAMLQRMIQERGSGFSMPPGMGRMNGALSSSANSSQQLFANMMMGNPSPDKKQRRS